MISRSGAAAGARDTSRPTEPRPAAAPLRRQKLPWRLMLAASLTVTACGSQWDNGGVAPSTVNVANAALSAGLYDLALNVSNAILARYPRDPGALAAKGDALLGTGNVVGAEQVYRTLLAIDPNSVRAMTGIGRVQLQSNPTEAEATFLRVLQRDPRNLAALSDLGVARDLEGRHADAQDAYRKALGIAPGNIAAQVNLGLSLALSGHAADAVGVLQPLADTPGAPDRIRNDLALAKSLSGEPAETPRAFAARSGETAPPGSGRAMVAEAALPAPRPASPGAVAADRPEVAQQPVVIVGATPPPSQPAPAPVQTPTIATAEQSARAPAAATAAPAPAMPTALAAGPRVQPASPAGSTSARQTVASQSAGTVSPLPGPRYASATPAAAIGSARVFPVQPHAVPELAAALAAAEAGCPLAWPAEASGQSASAPSSASPPSLAGWPIAGACGGTAQTPWTPVMPEASVIATASIGALATVGTELRPEQDRSSAEPVVSVLLPWPYPLATIEQDPARARALAEYVAAPIPPAPTRYTSAWSGVLPPDEIAEALALPDRRGVRPHDAWPFEMTPGPRGKPGASAPPAVPPTELTPLATIAGIPDAGLTIAAVPPATLDALEATANGRLGEPAATVTPGRGPDASFTVPVAQVASLDSEESARATWSILQARMPDILAGHAPIIVQADIGGRPYWRLRTDGFNSLDDARAFCDRVAAAGGGCWAALASN